MRRKNAKRTAKPVFFIVAILIFALTYSAFFGISNYYGDTKTTYIKGASDIRWGIDIQGGVEAVFSPEISEDEITNNDMDSAKSIIETRLVSQNITDYEVFTDYANHQVIVRFPWASDDSSQDAASAVAELGETAVLTFCEGQTYSEDAIILEGSEDIKSASPQLNQETGEYIVALELTSTGKSKFAEATANNIGNSIAICMDGAVISAPTVQEAITGGEASITGQFDAEGAKDLADKINAGSLPFSLSVDDSKLQIVSATLGSKALNVMLLAGAIAFGIICLIMILKYRLCGIISCIALVGQVGGMIACISGFFPDASSFTLTIPGIAGIILSIGIGVDANVIMFERIKEEFYNGKTIDGAIDTGYSNGFTAVLDGNITVMIVSLVLMGAFGSPDSILAKIFSIFFSSSITGSIYSFGYTLIIGVILNLVMGVGSSKLMLKSISQFKALRKPWLYGGAKQNASV